VQELENWLFPTAPPHLDVPRATLRVVCESRPDEDQPARHRLGVQFHLFRPRTGEKPRTLRELMDLAMRAAHEQELFPPADWEFIAWLAETHRARQDGSDTLILSDVELLHWLARWGHTKRLESALDGKPLQFHGQVATLEPHLENGSQELSFTHRLALSGGDTIGLGEVKFFNQQPPLILTGNTFYLLRNAPPLTVVERWAQKPSVPVRKLSHRLLMHLRKSQTHHGVDWEQLCVAHPAVPQFVFELLDETVRLRLLAKSQRDQSVWAWTGHEWQPHPASRDRRRPGEKPEILDDARLEAATQWLRKLDWFTAEPGVWTGDANENFLGSLAQAWPDRPKQAEYLGNPGFHRLFLTPRRLKPKLIVKGSGIDWLAVSAEWEAEGMKLSKADLERLAAATAASSNCPTPAGLNSTRPPSNPRTKRWRTWAWTGWSPCRKGRPGECRPPGRRGAGTVRRFTRGQGLRERIRDFKGAPAIQLPAAMQAELRPYQRTASISSRIWSRSNSAAFWPTTWAWARRCKHSRGSRGSKNGTAKTPNPRSLSVPRPCCTTGGARPNASRPASRCSCSKAVQHGTICANRFRSTI
jgi:hypothetical protein